MNRLVRKLDRFCIGCGICEYVAGRDHETSLTENGYLKPRDISKMTRANLNSVGIVCPGVRVVSPSPEPNIQRSRTWGNVLGIWKGHAVDEKTRFLGSSGGALSSFLVSLLEQGRVHGILQIGPPREGGLLSEYRISTSIEDVIECCGSRYSPASVLSGLREIRKQPDRQYVIVGRPCDMAGLREILRIDDALRNQVAVLVSFFCAGTPSLAGTRSLLENLGASEHEVRHVRYRGRGWPGKFRAEMIDGSILTCSYEKSWGEVLNRHLHLRCKLCVDGIGEAADVVFGDAWESEHGYPTFNEAPGESLVIARTARGLRHLQQAESGRYVRLERSRLDILKETQPYQKSRREFLFARLLACWLRTGIGPHYPGYGLWKFVLISNPLSMARQFFGMWRRLGNRHRAAS